MPGLSTNFGFSFSIMALSLGRMVSFAGNARAALQLVSLYKLDNAVMSPSQLVECVDAQIESPEDVTSLQTLHVGGSLLMQSMIARVRTHICSNVICAYGSTEAGTVAYAPASQLPPIDGVVGCVPPWIKLEILDENGSALSAEQEGVIRIQAEGLGRKVTIDETPSTATEDPNWFYPGDLGKMTKDGMLVVTGRVHDMINTGGLKLAPEYIEEIFRKHPAVEDVGALGIIAESGLEEIWVAVKTSQNIDAEELREFYRKSNPTYRIHKVVTVQAIHRNALGKIDRSTLRSRLLS